MDLDVVHDLNETQFQQLMDLYQHAWWTTERTRDDVREMLVHTDFVFAFVKPKTRELVAFARVLSDWVYFALVFDVIVAPDYRRKGIGIHVMDTVKNHPVLAQVENLELCCRDEMKPFYAQCGFFEATGRMQIKRKRGVQPVLPADADKPCR